jgi:[ribosomal protein S18]-alanine N-acetyltransferase
MTEIRPARPRDLEDVVTLEARTFGEEAWSPRSIENELEQLGISRLVDVAVDRGHVVGYVSVMYVGDSGDLLRIAVAATHRRLGLASRMLTRVLDQARERGLQQVVLEIAADNEAALALYARHGFVEIDRRSRYYRSGGAAVVMRVLLNARPRSEHEDSNDE